MNDSKQKKVNLKLKYVFYGEGLLNTVMLFICLFFPDFFLRQFSDLSVSLLGREMVRWYGVLLFVITFMMIGILVTEHTKSFWIVMLGYGIGDVMQIALAIYLAVILSSWSFAIIFTIAITIVLFLSRLVVLIKPTTLGFQNEQ